MKIVPHPEKAA